MATPLETLIGEGRARHVETMVDRLARSPHTSLTLLVVVAFACFLSGFADLPPLDGEEPSYAVAAREMVATGDFASLHVQTDLRPWRSRGAQWLEAATLVLTGQTGDPPVWVYRLPSLVGGVATVLLTWWTVIAFGRPRAALLAGLLVAASGLLGLAARQATPDAVLTAATTLAAGALARVWLGREARTPGHLPLLFWSAVGLGMLMKGIIAPAMAAAAVLLLSVQRRSFGWLAALRPATGVAILIIAGAPWLVSVALLSMGDAGAPDVPFLTRIGVPFSLEAPPGTYALLAPLLAGPAMTFIFLAVPWLFANPSRPAVLFALAWGAPLWLAAEFIPDKLPQAVLPAIPAVAMLAGVAIDAGVARIRGRVSLFYSAGPLIWPPLIAVVVPITFFMIEGHYPFAALAVFLVAAILGPVAWHWLRHEKEVAAAAMSVVTVAFIYLGFFGLIVPGLNVLRVAERIVAAGAGGVECRDPSFAAAGFPEESLVLAAGPGTLLTDGFGAADFLDAPGCRVAAIDVSQISSFRQRADDLGIDPIERGRVDGFNLRKMRRVNIHLFSARGA